MGRNRRCGLAAAGLGLLVSAGASGAWAMGCTSEGAVVRIPRDHSIIGIDYMQMQDAPVRATLWSERLGPRTTDNTQQALPKGAWTPVAFQNPAQFQMNPSKDWRLGVSALASDNGDFSKSFDCVDQELHSNGQDPYGYYVLSFIPHVNDPGQVAFQVRVRLQKGPLPRPVQKKPEKQARR